ncbi:hypothetical protein ACUWCL_29395, partial [Klebsiella pneumoniae]|uniref:hypothetical protein n=1 Tax=Klebsiella pneumoniae TaxID=573 RepID=UPI0040556B55
HEFRLIIPCILISNYPLLNDALMSRFEIINARIPILQDYYSAALTDVDIPTVFIDQDDGTDEET